jgi:hypothetical protein
MLTGIPTIALAMIGIVGWIGGWWWLVRSLPRGRRAVPLALIVVGVIAGGGLYLTVIGPWLLP